MIEYYTYNDKFSSYDKIQKCLLKVFLVCSKLIFFIKMHFNKIILDENVYGKLR